MTAAREGVSGSGSNTRRAVPASSVGDAGTATRVSPASSPPRSKALLSRAAMSDTRAEPVSEATSESSPRSLTEHRLASPSRSRCIRDGHCQLHSGDGTPITPLSVKEQGSLPTGTNLVKPPATLQNIRMLTARQSSVLDRGGAFSGQIHPKVSVKENEVCDHLSQHTDTLSSHISSGSNHSGKFMKPASATSRDFGLQTSWRPSQLDTRECDWNYESDGAFEGSNHSTVTETSPMPRNVKQETSSQPSLLDRRVDGSRQEPQGYIHKAGPAPPMHPSNNCRQHVNERDAVNGSRFLNDTKDDNKGYNQTYTWDGETYSTTLGHGGGYGYPHHPPFYKCDICRKETALYWLKCCTVAVCERCGCTCEEDLDENKVQYQSEKGRTGKEKLPEVKLEGSDLFLWQQCSFPSDLMLCMAKRTGSHLQYYFAPIDKLMDPAIDKITATLYDFGQQGNRVTSLSVTEQNLLRDQLNK